MRQFMFYSSIVLMAVMVIAQMFLTFKFDNPLITILAFIMTFLGGIHIYSAGLYEGGQLVYDGEREMEKYRKELELDDEQSN